jgi:hypothetical protein
MTVASPYLFRHPPTLEATPEIGSAQCGTARGSVAAGYIMGLAQKIA